MKLPEQAIKNYQFVFIIVLLGMVIGLSSFLNMPRSEDPNTNFPNYSIVAVYPGTGPEDMEELLFAAVESLLSDVSAGAQVPPS